MRWTLGITLACLFAASASAGIVHSKAGARASVSHTAQFQALIDDLEAHGAVIKFMGGWRRGWCGQSSKHPCGLALDVCQYARGVVDRRCHLPGPKIETAIAAEHGLFHGAAWCHGDRGHFEFGGSWACGGRYVAYHDKKAKTEIVKRVLPHPILMGAM